MKAITNKDGNININFDKQGKVSCQEAEEGSLNSYRYYERESGKDKVIVRSQATGLTTFYNQKNNIINNNYNVLAGIDTNDYEINGRKISIASSFYAPSIESSSVEVKIMSSFIISDVTAGLNSEVVGWYLFIKHIFPSLKLEEGFKLGLVVDSELGKHVAINNQKEAYYKDNFLPVNIGLIYASSDTGQDLPNQLIKLCDKSSRELFNKIKIGELHLPNNLGGESDDFSGYAIVNHP